MIDGESIKRSKGIFKVFIGLLNLTEKHLLVVVARQSMNHLTFEFHQDYVTNFFPGILAIDFD